MLGGDDLVGVDVVADDEAGAVEGGDGGRGRRGGGYGEGFGIGLGTDRGSEDGESGAVG